jgi:hypothetical protein
LNLLVPTGGWSPSVKIWLAKDETAMMISKAGSALAKWRKSCQAAIELPCGGGVDDEKLDRGVAPAQQGDECLGADVCWVL